eukprot:TRINITY_DN24361_c0_g1_i2.p1 TRINITY_DN24361_c0_g1~~TRINITY_DN24361_c0_g1_i2.p1  ORF type:complete len:412 (-),score=73.39 TRINITY_DN24361_c0_g1_i2:175-1410(-)
MGVVIVANSMCIGAESSAEIRGADTGLFQLLDHLFLLSYCLELGLRFYVLGRDCLESHWVKFDLLLVAVGVLSSWVLEPIMELVEAASPGAVGDSDNNKGVKALMVLRVLRLFRLARTVRLLVQFKTLWMLVRGLLSSANTILYTFVLIVIMLYIAACLTAEMVTKPYKDSPDEVMAQLVQDHFPDILPAMLTYVQFVTVDSVGAIYVPMIARDPALMLLFLPFMLIVSVALMNLVTAVIVESAIEQAGQDKEAQIEWKKQKVAELLPELRALFHELDEDKSGLLTKQEMGNCDEDMKEELLQYLATDDFEDIFDILDEDGSGEINIDEFCECISKLASEDSPLEFTKIIRQLESVKATQAKNMEYLKEQQMVQTEAIFERLDTLAQNQKRMEGEFTRTLNRLEKALASRR